jgi:hypothetical protein
MDIVYLVKEDHENDSEELRCSLRSLKNIPHGKVFIVGEKPAWVKNVGYIAVEQSRTKNENVGNNMKAAVWSEAISDDFILMNDDFFFMKPVANMPTLNFGLMRNVIEDYNGRYPEGSDYIANMTHLYDELRRRGIDEPLSFELHMPMMLNRKKVQQLYEKVTDRLYQFRSFYGNYFGIQGETIPDVKIFLDDDHNAVEYKNNPDAYLKSQTFLSATGGSFKKGRAGEFIRSAFPEKSDYEV